MNYSTDYLQQYAAQTAIQNGLPPDLVLAQISAESSWNPNAFNPAGPDGGAMGLGQCIASTCAEYGVNLSDPLSQIHGVVNYDYNLVNDPTGCNGDYVCALQKYGTLPKSLSNLNPGQQAALTAAQNANAGANSEACSVLQGFYTGLNPAFASFMHCGGTNGSDCATLDFVCKIKASGLNLLSIIVGLILIAAGLYALKSPADLESSITNVKYNVSRQVGATKRLAGLAKTGTELAAA